MDMELVEDQFTTQVMKHLFQSRGIDLSGYSQSFMMRSIKKRLGRSGKSDPASYLQYLINSEEETNELLGALSINVTEFFRDKGAFEAFSKEVIRPLLQSKVGCGGLLRIWSAGCATGQETYTIAICVSQELRRLESDPRILVSVLGTDLSSAALIKAKSGIYRIDEVGGVPDKLLSEYFERKGEAFAVNPSLRRGVRFVRENLLDKPGSRYFDAIVCRNVMIYFSRTMHDKVTMHLYEALKNGGYLMLGRTETLMGSPRAGFDVIDLENRILRKK
jgi:chemotaxis methyl-accepting protein methylase